MDDVFVDLRLPSAWLSRYPLDRDGLFTKICSLLTDEMLDVIANCDHGQDCAEHHRALARIRAGIGWDDPIGRIPDEILCLYRWSEPQSNRELKPLNFHIARTFAACALLRIPELPENRDLFENESVAATLDSCIALGRPFLHDLLRWLAWALGTLEPWDEDYRFLMTGFLVAYANRHPRDRDGIASLGVWYRNTMGILESFHRSWNSTPREMANLWLEFKGEWNPKEFGVEPDRLTLLDDPHVSLRRTLWRGLIVSMRDSLPLDDILGSYLARV